MSRLARIIGARLRNAREDMGLTHQEVADRIGLTAAGYGHYERGNRLPPIDQLVKLTTVLGRSINYFLDLPSDKCDLSADEEQLVRDFRAVNEPQIRQMILEMTRVGAHLDR